MPGTDLIEYPDVKALAQSWHAKVEACAVPRMFLFIPLLSKTTGRYPPASVDSSTPTTALRSTVSFEVAHRVETRSAVSISTTKSNPIEAPPYLCTTHQVGVLQVQHWSSCSPFT